MTTLIRFATPDDGPALAEIYAPAITEQATSFEFEPPDGAEMARRVSRLLARFPWLVCQRGARVVGYAYGGVHRERAAYQWSVEVSVYVRSDAHRSGIGRAIYTSLFAVLALQGFRRAYAGMTLPNPASEGVHRAMGFTPVGVFHGIGYKFGQWHDVAWFEREIAERIIDPPAPRPLAELRDDPLMAPALEAALSTGVSWLKG